MAYSDDAVRAKLSALNETQDSIVTVAQWIMFHRRHADRTASLWLNRLQESTSPAKRLNLLYLANEVVQQSRARSRHDFLHAFEPLIADATAFAYKGASQDVQGKLRRVIEVWRQRQIFDTRVQDQIEKGLDDLDRQKGGKGGGGGGGRLGGSLFGGGTGAVPLELEAASKSLAALNKAEAASKAPLSSANAEFEKYSDPDAQIPSAPMRAARLRGLARELMAAQGAVDASIRAREQLLAGLEQLIEKHRASLTADQTTRSDVANKIDGIEATIRDVEDSIMRGQDMLTPPLNGDANGTASDPERPEPEGFTPPPTQDEPSDVDNSAPLIGDGTSIDEMYANTTGAEPIEEQPSIHNEPPPSFEPPPAIDTSDPNAAAKEFLESLNLPQVRHASSEIPASIATGTADDPRLKRRKTNHRSEEIDDEIFGAGNTGVDEDSISAMLAQ